MDRLERHLRPLRPRDPERAQPPLVLGPLGFLDRRNLDVGRVDALREIPDPLAPDAAGDRDLAAHDQELEHLGDVPVVRPTARLPRHDGCVRDLAGGQRAVAAESIQDVAPERVVCAEPLTRPLVVREVRGAGEVETEVAHRPDQRVALEERALLLERSLELGGLVARAQATPRDEVRARRDGCSRVDLQ